MDGAEHILTKEHIIPECIGGWITIPYLCKKCNNDLLGSKIESRLKQNAYIVSAIDKLGLQPANKAFNRANISLDFENGIQARGRFTEDRRVLFVPTEQSDGSLIVSENDAKKLLVKKVQRFETANNLNVNFDPNSYNSMHYDQLVTIPGTNISYIKRRKQSATTIISKLTEPISFMIPTSIAFKVIAGFSYTFVCQPAFDPLRDWIQNDSLKNKVLLINPIHPSQIPNEFNYEPYHYLRYSMINDGFVAFIVLFNQLVFSVFLGFNPDLSFLPTQDLLDKYIVFDLRKRDLTNYTPPKKIFLEDTYYLYSVYHLANYELRKKPKK